MPFAPVPIFGSEEFSTLGKKDGGGAGTEGRGSVLSSPTRASLGSRPAPEACFHVVNCGKDEEGSSGPCSKRWGEEQRERS